MSKKIGIFGLGSIGSRHKANLEAMGHTVLGFDPDKVAPEHAGRDVQEVFRESDAIVIASPTDTHIKIMEMALVHKKPIFVEKPISDHDPERVHRALQEAAEKSLPVFMGNNLRFHSCIPFVREWLEEATEDGDPPIWAQFTVGQFSKKHPYLRDGVLLNWGSHEVDLALHLLGAGKTAAAALHSHWGTSDDVADITIHHYRGIRSSIHMDYISDPEVRDFRIVGREWQIGCDLVKRRATISGKTQDAFQGTDNWDQNYIDEMKAFINCIDGKPHIGATGEDGLEALRIICDAREKAE